MYQITSSCKTEGIKISLVSLERSAIVDTDDGSGTVPLAEDSALAAFFPLADFLALGAKEHLLAI